jgi:hypothetical protein
MTIRSNTDLGRRAETHLATITGTSNSIFFHAGHRKLGMSDRNRDNLLVGEPPKRVQEIVADNLSKAGWSWGCVSAVDSSRRTIWIAGDEKLTAFVELERAIRSSNGQDCAAVPV